MSPTIPPRRDLASITDAAAYFDCAPRTVRRWISSGLLPAYRLGPRLLKVDLSEAENVLRRIPTAGAAAC